MTEMYGVSRKRIVGETWFWVAMVLLLAGVIGVAWWAISASTAPTRGQVGAFQQKESTDNRIFAQQSFEQASADIEGYVAKIKFARSAYKAQPTDVNQTNLQGLQQQCVNTVQQYNADARKYLLRDFRSADLLSRQDPAQCG